MSPDDLLMVLGERPARGVQRWLHEGLRAAIRAGRLPAGQRLPSSRPLAVALQVARGTVTGALELLIAEGFVVSAPRSGLVIATVGGSPVNASAPQASGPASPGTPDGGLFPAAGWTRALRAAVAGMGAADLGYPDPQGHLTLRIAVAERLRRTRGALVDADCIVITGGVAQAQALICEVLVGRGRSRIGIEEPGAPGGWQLLRHHGMQLVPVPVDEQGMGVPLDPDLGAAIITPAHQFPLGMSMSAARRRELVAWAQQSGAFLFEDDYDAELRYDRPGLPALQALDPDRVALVGSVSKTLSPAIRLGWLAVPNELRGAVIDAKHFADLGNSVIEQLAFEDALVSGGYQRHIRSVTREYARRRQLLLDVVDRVLPGAARPGIAAGLHFVVDLPDHGTEHAVLGSLHRAGIAAIALSACYLGAPEFGVVLGTARLWADLEAALRDGLAAGSLGGGVATG